MSAKIQATFETVTALRTRISERIQSIALLPRKTLESLALFAALGTVYSFYLQAQWSATSCVTVDLDLSHLLTYTKFIVFTGWPFALLAFLDGTWTSKDAGRVFLPAYLAANGFWMQRYHQHFCPYSFAFLVFPYVLSAAVGHSIGAATQSPDETIADYR